MEPGYPDRVLAFDALFTTNHIQMLKLLIGYMEPSMQGKLAAYIKFMELKHTLDLITKYPHIRIGPENTADASPPKISALLEDILPFSTPAQRTQLENLKNMFQTMDNMQEMMEMMELIKEMSPELFEGGMNFTQEGDMSQMMDMMQMMQGMFGGTDSSAP